MPSASPVGIDQLGLYLGELRMGRLLYRRVDRAFAVEVTPEFLASGHDIAPIIYPHLDVFREGIVEYRGEPKATSPFIAGLPGFIVDSLPDRWGQLLADREAPGKEWTIMDSLASIGATGGRTGSVTAGQPPWVPAQARRSSTGLRLTTRSGGTSASTALAQPRPSQPS